MQVSSVAVLIVSAGSASAAQDGESHSHCALHFEHPLVTESLSPDTKIRTDYRYVDQAGGKEQTGLVEGEYALNCNASLGVALTYTFLDPNAGSSRDGLDNANIFVKTASYRFADRGWLLGGGLELGLPTGDDNKGIGSNNELEIEPFLSAAYQRGNFEAVTFVNFGIPTNQSKEEKDEIDLEVSWSSSLAYRVTPRIMVLLEVDGETVAIGDEDETVVNISPGIKFRQQPDYPLSIGLSAGFPLSDDEAFDESFFLSVFYHF